MSSEAWSDTGTKQSSRVAEPEPNDLAWVHVLRLTSQVGLGLRLGPPGPVVSHIPQRWRCWTLNGGGGSQASRRAVQVTLPMHYPNLNFSPRGLDLLQRHQGATDGLKE